MAKLKIFRQSGLPVSLEQYEAYQEEYVKCADKIGERAGLDMLKSMRMYRFVEHCLKLKHSDILEVELPKSNKAAKELIKKFGCPITLALSAEKQELICLLLDEMQ